MICPLPFGVIITSPLVSVELITLPSILKLSALNCPVTDAVPVMVWPIVVMADWMSTIPVPCADIARLALVAGDLILSENTVP